MVDDVLAILRESDKPLSIGQIERAMYYRWHQEEWPESPDVVRAVWELVERGKAYWTPSREVAAS